MNPFQMFWRGSRSDRAFTGRHGAFGTMPDGQKVEIFHLKNARGMEANIITYGGAVQSIKVPDQNGKIEDVALGFDNLNDYLHTDTYFGALIGATPIASPKASSRSTARRTTRPSTTARTPCTAAPKASTRRCGRPRRSRRPTPLASN
jgi:hypothetical protein